jgi:D-alanyl-D-alanine carboxypeptidase/D-alanyl-D-alanine-endopeptidase (penicillin-binding protein 4)
MWGYILFQSTITFPAAAQVPPQIPQGGSTTICANQLAQEITSTIERPEWQRYRWGIVVESLSGTQLYHRDGDRLFTPASNVKLLTTAVALRQLGSNTRLRTSVYQLPGNRSQPSLLVVGRGDPSLSTTGLQAIGQQIRQRGYRQLAQINFDDSYFRGEQINPNWEWGDLSTDYAPGVNSLILNQNALALTVSPQQVGSPLRYTWSDPYVTPWPIENQTVTTADNISSNVNAIAMFGKSGLKLTGQLAQNANPLKIDLAVANPTASFIGAFRQILNQQQISVANTQLVSGQNTSHLTEIAFINSPPISELVKETNLKSNNLYAEVLLKSLGKTHPQHPISTAETTDLGLEIVRQGLTQLAVNPQSYRLKDGSGLSRHNLVTPNTLVRVLSAMAKLPEGKIYRDSLPIAGVSGSLKNRMKGTAAEGIVRAKTGSMTGVIGLSGYINPPQYSPLVFSILLDRHDRRTAEMARVIDEIVVLLARLKRC